MTFRRNRFRLAALLALAGALSTAGTSVAHGTAHLNSVSAHADADFPLATAILEGHDVETDHAPDHAVLHDRSYASRQTILSPGMPEGRVAAFSLAVSLIDSSHPPVASIVRISAAYSRGADFPRAPPA